MMGELLLGIELCEMGQDRESPSPEEIPPVGGALGTRERPFCYSHTDDVIQIPI